VRKATISISRTLPSLPTIAEIEGFFEFCRGHGATPGARVDIEVSKDSSPGNGGVDMECSWEEA
jgi:hypothetical protein